MIPILPIQSWAEFRGQTSKTELGANLTTHKALIRDETGKLHYCYVKISPQGRPTPITEGIAWLIARELDLPRPEFAALIIVPINRLRESGMRLDQHWDSYQRALGFCSEAVQGKSLAQGWKWGVAGRTTKFFRSGDARRIIAFDEWTDNADRHSGNMMRSKEGYYVPIDNEYILHEILWNKGLSRINRLLPEGRTYLTPADHLRLKVEAAQASHKHAAAITSAEPHIKMMISQLMPNAVQALQISNDICGFLHTRSGRDWLAKKLEVIA
jgi:hypothetical protein